MVPPRILEDYIIEETYNQGLEDEQMACYIHPHPMEIGETLYVTNREGFRQWLAKHHRSKKEIWLIQYKKATRKPSIDYVEAVEEAICFGWIDGLEKRMDAERYALRFSPRRPKSNWTETNKERARKMVAQGKMMEAGLATLPKDF